MRHISQFAELNLLYSKNSSIDVNRSTASKIFTRRDDSMKHATSLKVPKFEKQFEESSWKFDSARLFVENRSVHWTPNTVSVQNP